MAMPRLDLIGRQFGELRVISFVGMEKRQSRWLVRCSCGEEKAVRGSWLLDKRGKVRSCGHLKGTGAVHPNTGATIHRRSTPEYQAWLDLRQRCFNPKNPFFKHYGGRGISVCDRWRDSFANFLFDMGRKPSRELSIDRVDNDGNYEPANCRWATWSQQNANQRKHGPKQK